MFLQHSGGLQVGYLVGWIRSQVIHRSGDLLVGYMKGVGYQFNTTWFGQPSKNKDFKT